MSAVVSLLVAVSSGMPLFGPFSRGCCAVLVLLVGCFAVAVVPALAGVVALALVNIAASFSVIALHMDLLAKASRVPGPESSTIQHVLAHEAKGRHAHADPHAESR